MQAPEQKRRGRSEEGRDSLTPEQEQVKKLTGFTMGHLQALRHSQQRAELCRKAQGPMELTPTPAWSNLLDVDVC